MDILEYGLYNYDHNPYYNIKPIWEIIWFYHVPVGALALASTADSSSERSLAPCAWLTKIAEIVEIGVKYILML